MHKKILGDFLEKVAYKGISISKDEFKKMMVRGLKKGPNWKNKQISLSMGPTFLVSELAYATDVAVQVNFDLEQLESDKEKREFLSQYTTSPPEYARNLESIIPSEVMKAAKTKKNPNPFNFPKPSDASVARVTEISHRKLVGFDIEFNDERKLAIFRMVVNAIIKNLTK